PQPQQSGGTGRSYERPYMCRGRGAMWRIMDTDENIRQRTFLHNSPHAGPILRMKTTHAVDNRERVLLLGVSVRKSRTPAAGSAVERENLLELEELARSAGGYVTGSLLQVRDKIDPATLVGKGKL